MKEVQTLFDAFQKSFDSNGLNLDLFKNFKFTDLFQESLQTKIKQGLDSIKNLPENSEDREPLIQQFKDQFEKSKAAIQAALRIHGSFGTKKTRQKNDPFLMFISNQKSLVQEEEIEREIEIMNEAREEYMKDKQIIDGLKEKNKKIIQLYKLDVNNKEIDDSNFTEIDELIFYNKSIYYNLKYNFVDVFSKFLTEKKPEEKVGRQNIQKRINFISNIVLMAKQFQAFYDTNFAENQT